MAKFEQSVDSQEGLTVITAAGDVAPGEMVACWALRNKDRQTPRVVWNLLAANWASIPTHALLRDFDALRGLTGGNGRTAFVLGNEVDYGMGRIVESYTALQGFAGEYRPFRKLEEAMAWLFSENELSDDTDFAARFGF